MALDIHKRRNGRGVARGESKDRYEKVDQGLISIFRCQTGRNDGAPRDRFLVRIVVTTVT